jgi:hypothetical protein
MEEVLSPVSCCFCFLSSAQHKLIYDPGIIMAALGMETSSGDFEVIDICFAGIPDPVKTEAGPSGANGSVKGKEKARAGEGSEGQLADNPSMTHQADPTRRQAGCQSIVREDLDCAGIRLVCRHSGGTSGSQGAAIGGLADRRRRRASSELAVPRGYTSAS